MSVLCLSIASRDRLLLDEGSGHTGGGAKVLLRIKGIGRVDMWTNIASVGITARIPKGPSGSGGSAGDGGGVGLEEVELIGWILVDSTTDDNQEHEKKSSGDEDKGNEGERCP